MCTACQLTLSKTEGIYKDKNANKPVDVGPLRTARYTEPFALLVAQIAYEGDRGPAMAYSFEWLEEHE